TLPYTNGPVDDFGEPLFDANGDRITRSRLSYIAPHRANAGVDFDWQNGLRASLRANYVGARILGADTSDAYKSADAVVSYRYAKANATLQLIVQNLFDGTYFAPSPDGPLPQKGRALYLR